MQKVSAQVFRRTSFKRQNMHYAVSKLKTTRSLLDRKPDRKRTVLTEEILYDAGARFGNVRKKISHD